MKASVKNSELSVGGMPAVRLQSADLEIELVPELGAKMVSLRHLSSGRQWLWRDPHRAFRPASYGDDFASYDLSGFDECFPTIGGCYYPDAPFTGVFVPDHGEVWSLPWELELTSLGARLQTRGVRFPYVFEKRIDLLDGARMRIVYQLTNPSSAAFKCFWSAHPLFAVEPGMQVLLPGQPRLSQELMLGGNRLRRDAFLSELRWPLVTGEDDREHDLRELPATKGPVIDKVFAGPLEMGWCAIWSPGSGDYVGFSFDPAHVSRVGVCVTLGMNPADEGAWGWVALEPGTGSTDRLDISILRGQYQLLSGKQTMGWELTLAAGRTTSFRGLSLDGFPL
jgi:galactose mutarotase-like enzyme